MSSGNNPTEADRTEYVGLRSEFESFNGILQTLFMTPEFRQRLYEMKFDSSTGDQKSIGHHLQELYIQLQFGRDSANPSEFYNCFAEKHEGIKKANVRQFLKYLVDAIGSGAMLDLFRGTLKCVELRCNECHREKSAELVFSDLMLDDQPNPLPVEVMLLQFFEGTVIDGINCLGCNKIVRAYKGFEVNKWPHILVLNVSRPKLSGIALKPADATSYELYSVIAVGKDENGKRTIRTFIKNLDSKAWFLFGVNVTRVDFEDVKLFSEAANRVSLIYREDKPEQNQPLKIDVPDHLQAVLKASQQKKNF